MISQAFTDCLAQVCTLLRTGKFCGRQPSAEPTALEQSIVGYTSHISFTLSEVSLNIPLRTRG